MHYRVGFITMICFLLFIGCKEQDRIESSQWEKITELETRLSQAEENIVLLSGIKGKPKVATEKASAKPKVEAPSENREIRAKAFVLVDDQGRMRGLLSTANGNPSLVLSDANGNPRAALILDKKGPALGLSDENNTLRAALSAFSPGSALYLYDATNKIRASISTAPDTESAMVLFDRAGTLRFMVSTNLLLLGPGGKQVLNRLP